MGFQPKNSIKLEKCRLSYEAILELSFSELIWIW